MNSSTETIWDKINTFFAEPPFDRSLQSLDVAGIIGSPTLSLYVLDKAQLPTSREGYDGAVNLLSGMHNGHVLRRLCKLATDGLPKSQAQLENLIAAIQYMDSIDNAVRSSVLRDLVPYANTKDLKTALIDAYENIGDVPGIHYFLNDPNKAVCEYARDALTSSNVSVVETPWDETVSILVEMPRTLFEKLKGHLDGPGRLKGQDEVFTEALALYLKAYSEEDSAQLREAQNQ